MLIIISPAKTLDFDSKANIDIFTQNDFLGDAEELVHEIRKMTVDEISEFMSISPKLAQLNFERFINWQRPFSPENAKQALPAFKGDVYTGINSDTFDNNDYLFAQKCLRILSGLYGLLRPLDLMQPYRLEMGKKLENNRAKDLYGFWADKITTKINETLNEHNHETLINLASNEYYKAVNQSNIQAEIITPVFKEERNGKFKVIAIHAKKARGLMTRFIIKNKLSNPEELKLFDKENYFYNDKLSKANEWVFCR